MVDLYWKEFTTPILLLTTTGGKSIRKTLSVVSQSDTNSLSNSTSSVETSDSKTDSFLKLNSNPKPTQYRAATMRHQRPSSSYSPLRRGENIPIPSTKPPRKDEIPPLPSSKPPPRPDMISPKRMERVNNENSPTEENVRKFRQKMNQFKFEKEGSPPTLEKNAIAFKQRVEETFQKVLEMEKILEEQSSKLEWTDADGALDFRDVFQNSPMFQQKMKLMETDVIEFSQKLKVLHKIGKDMCISDQSNIF